MKYNQGLSFMRGCSFVLFIIFVLYPSVRIITTSVSKTSDHKEINKTGLYETAAKTTFI